MMMIVNVELMANVIIIIIIIPFVIKFQMTEKCCVKNKSIKISLFRISRLM